MSQLFKTLKEKKIKKDFKKFYDTNDESNNEPIEIAQKCRKPPLKKAPSLPWTNILKKKFRVVYIIPNNLDLNRKVSIKFLE